MANKSCQANTERASCKTIDHTVSLYQYLASYILFNDIYVTDLQFETAQKGRDKNYLMDN